MVTVIVAVCFFRIMLTVGGCDAGTNFEVADNMVTSSCGSRGNHPLVSEGWRTLAVQPNARALVLSRLLFS